MTTAKRSKVNVMQSYYATLDSYDHFGEGEPISIIGICDKSCYENFPPVWGVSCLYGCFHTQDWKLQQALNMTSITKLISVMEMVFVLAESKVLMIWSWFNTGISFSVNIACSHLDNLSNRTEGRVSFDSLGHYDIIALPKGSTLTLLSYPNISQTELYFP